MVMVGKVVGGDVGGGWAVMLVGGGEVDNGKGGKV